MREKLHQTSNVTLGFMDLIRDDRLGKRCNSGVL